MNALCLDFGDASPSWRVPVGACQLAILEIRRYLSVKLSPFLFLFHGFFILLSRILHTLPKVYPRFTQGVPKVYPRCSQVEKAAITLGKH